MRSAPGQRRSAGSGDDRDGADREPLAAPPVGAVLGPLPVWAVSGIVAALGGEWAAHRFAVVTPGVHRGAAGWVVLGSVVIVGAGSLRWRARTRRESVGTPAHPGMAGGSVCRPHGVVGGFLGVLLVAAVCAVGAGLRITTNQDGLLPELARQGGSRAISAVVVQEPRRVEQGWIVLLRVDEVAGTATRERAATTLVGDPPVLGSRWVGRASARPLPDGGYGRWLARQHVTTMLDVSPWAPAGDPGALAGTSEYVRERVRLAATRHLGERTGGLLVGFVTGDTRLLPASDVEAMRASGLGHLTAVSGSNVAIVVGGVLLVSTFLRLPAPWRRRCVAVTVAWFALVTRFEPSVLRASGMVLLLLAVAARGVVRDVRHALAGAVLLLVLLDPMLAASTGLLLSAAATVGVLVIAPRVRERLPARPRRLGDVASITLGAQIAVVPLLLLTFGEVSVASVPANLVAVPAAAVAAVVAFVAGVAAVVHPAAGAVVFVLAGIPAQVVLRAAHVFADIGGRAEVARPATVAALLATIGWILVRPGSRYARWMTAVALVAAVGAVLPWIRGSLPPRDFSVTAIDVGQGDAFLIESPGTRIVVDGGGDDAAARWLRSHGRRRIDLVVVTHPHLDHVGGIAEILRRSDVGALWFRARPTDLAQVDELLHVAGDRDIAVRAPATGDRLTVGDLSLEVLHAPEEGRYRWAASDLNESSIVLRIHHGDRRVLVTGDIEAGAQADLLATSAASLRAELLLVPHHGAATSLPDFFAAVDPLIGLISVGNDNRHGHPDPSTLATLTTSGVEVHRTDVDGTTRVVVPQRGEPAPARPLRSSP